MARLSDNNANTPKNKMAAISLNTIFLIKQMLNTICTIKSISYPSLSHYLISKKKLLFSSLKLFLYPAMINT